MEYRSAEIYVRNRYAGKLSETEEGYEFQYSLDYLRDIDASSVSLTLPLQEEKFFPRRYFLF